MRGVDSSSYTVFLALIVLLVAIDATVVYRLKRDVEEDARPVTDERISPANSRTGVLLGEMNEAEYRRVTEALQGAEDRGRHSTRSRRLRPIRSPQPEPEPEPVPDAGTT